MMIKLLLFFAIILLLSRVFGNSNKNNRGGGELDSQRPDANSGRTGSTGVEDAVWEDVS